jgi:hypothetical protein
MSARERRKLENDAAREWKGGYRPYDLVKELCIAIGVVLALVVLLTILFSSPDDRPSTVASWSKTDPVDFVTTAVSQLDGTSGTAGYGPPYNHNSDGQHIAFLYPQKWAGVTFPIDTAQDFVLAPLASITGQPALTQALSTYNSASAKQQMAWTNAYSADSALGKATANSNGTITVPGTTSSYGPVPQMMNALLADAQAGGLDGRLLTNQQFYQTDYTKPLLYLADGSLLSDRAQEQHLLGEQWGMMNETGSYPGQVWLWLYTFWYQIKPFSTSANADVLVMAVMGVLSLAFILIPFIPGVRDLPRLIPIYKLIWRDHYRTSAGARAP